MAGLDASLDTQFHSAAVLERKQVLEGVGFTFHFKGSWLMVQGNADRISALLSALGPTWLSLPLVSFAQKTACPCLLL